MFFSPFIYPLESAISIVAYPILLEDKLRMVWYKGIYWTLQIKKGKGKIRLWKTIHDCDFDGEKTSIAGNGIPAHEEVWIAESTLESKVDFLISEY